MDKVAIYCRLSKEDQDKLDKGDDSGSIQNQKLMLVDYATSHDMQIYKIYSDDDFTGSDITRPNWNKMLNDAKTGHFNIVLCKTQSRFARSLEVVEKYINGLFIEWGIRFISIIDNIDTNISSTKKASQINGLIDQWYLEDLSENIRKTYRQKMMAAQYLGSFAPYGYKKDPENKYKLIIDEEAANVIKIIFNLSLSGYGVNIISQKLSEMNIPTPTEYKKNKGFNFYNPNSQIYSKRGYWGFTTLKRILNNPVYIGTLTQGREKTISYKNKKVVIAPKEDWVVIENNHEAIISKEDFERTQELLQVRRKTCKTTNGKYYQPHLFAGRIRCRDCDSTMTKTSGSLAGGHDYFWCQLSKKSNGEKCSRHSIRYDRLEKAITSRIKKMMSDVLDKNNNITDIKKYFNKDNNNEKKAFEINAKIQKNEIKIEDMNNSVSNLYMDKVKGILTETEFINIKNNISKQIEDLTESNKSLKNELKLYKDDNKKVDEFMNAINKHKDFETLTTEIISDFIICIYVYETNNKNEQELDIAWNI